MRDREPWMRKGTDPILEALDEAGVPLSVSTIRLIVRRESSAELAKRTAYDAIEELLENGYIDEVDWSPTHYEITDRGREYLQSG